MRMKLCTLLAAVFAVPAWGLPLTVQKITPGPGREVLPLSAVPIAGFQPKLAVTLTDRSGPNDFAFTSIASNYIGNSIGSGHTFLATLDSGGQSHIISAADAAMIDLDASNRAGTYTIEVQGASGSEELDISDALGVFGAGVQRLTSTNPLSVPQSGYRGQIRTSILTAREGSLLPSIIGVPMFGQYQMQIRNSQTLRVVAGGQAPVRTPSIELASLGTPSNLPFNLALELADPLNSATSAPAFFPDIGGSFANPNDNPLIPTFWTFPFANTSIQNVGPSGSGAVTSSFLFDTGAQVTVVSEATADALGFDIGTDTPDFTIEVLGVGGVRTVPGFFVDRLELPVTGGSFVLEDVPVLVLNITNPRTGIGAVPGIIGMNLFNDRDLTVNMQASNPFVRIGAPLVAQWNTDASGTWTNDLNWVLGSPDGVENPARFMGAITADRTVTLDDSVTVGSMVFDNVHRYTIAGTGEITVNQIAREGSIHVVTGSHRVDVAVGLEVDSELRVEAGAAIELASLWTSRALSKTGAGTLTLERAGVGTLDIEEGVVRVAGDAARLDVTALSITGSASADLGSAGALIVDYVTPSAYASVLSLVTSGKLVSTAPGLVVGLSEISEVASSWPGADASSIVALATLAGDTDLDRTVGFGDLLRLAQAYDVPGGRWATGDFNHDGLVDFTDLLTLAQNYGVSAVQGTDLEMAHRFESDWALARSLVPEPTSLLMIGGAVMFLRRRV